MSAGENQDVAVERPKPRHDPIDPLGDLQDGLAAGTTVAEEIPLGALSLYLHTCPTLVETVVPFEDLRVEYCAAHKAGKLACSQRSPKRAREHVIERQVFEPEAERASL